MTKSGATAARPPKTPSSHKRRVRNIYGLPALAELLGDKIASKVAEWLDYEEAAAAANTEPPEQSQQGHIAPAGSEEDLALKFADRHAAELRYVAAWNKWLRWEKGCWQPDATLAVYDHARMLCRTEATRTNKPGKKATMIASAKTRAAVVSLAREDRRIAATIEQWDADPWLFNTPDGIVDLRAGTMRSHRPDDYTTKMTAVGPPPDPDTDLGRLPGARHRRRPRADRLPLSNVRLRSDR